MCVCSSLYIIYSVVDDHDARTKLLIGLIRLYSMANLNDIIKAFEEALDCWGLVFSGSEGLKTIPPAKVQEPLKELVKVAKLIKAHTTKVGIIFEPSKLAQLSDAAYTTVSDLSKSFVLYMSVVAQLSPDKISSLFYKEILISSHTLVSTAASLTAELKVLNDKSGKSSDDKNNTKVDVRLVSVGKLWNACDELVKLVENGNLKFLEKKTRLQLSLIEDGLDEFSEWAENPEEFDLVDPFGLDEFSEDDEEDGEDAEDAKVPVADDGESSSSLAAEATMHKLSGFSKQWVQKFKLIKLLFLSINKSLPSIVNGTDIDEIYNTESIISKEADLLIVELMMSHSLTEDVTEHSIAVDKACSKILSILKKANKNSDNKTKWCSSWEIKYKEMLEAMYD